MKNLLMAGALAVASSAVGAVPVEFNVPVEVSKVIEAATHVDVTCGSWDNTPGARRFLRSQSVRVALQAGQKNKSYSGVVKVVVPFPGATAPTGTYRCAMALRTAQGLTEFASQPAAPRTLVSTEVMGSFSELNFQQGTSATARPPVAPPPLPAKK